VSVKNLPEDARRALAVAGIPPEPAPPLKKLKKDPNFAASYPPEPVSSRDRIYVQLLHHKP